MIPFCDWLSCSFGLDDWDGLRARLAPVMDAAAAGIERQRDGKPGWIYRPGLDGAVNLYVHQDVGVLTASGGSLTSLRSLGLFGEYLMAIGSMPHRITRVDATVDVSTDAPPVVNSVAAVARDRGLALSRKAIAVGDIKTFLGLDARGVLTGSVYLGSSRARVRGVVYDKRHERESKGFPDPGPWLRYELRFRGDMGLTLRDAWDPSPVFWHYASPDLLRAPAGVVPWVPYGEGFHLEPRADLSPGLLLQRRVEADPGIDRLIELADQVGPGGREWLAQLVMRRLGLAKRYDRMAPRQTVNAA